MSLSFFWLQIFRWKELRLLLKLPHKKPLGEVFFYVLSVIDEECSSNFDFTLSRKEQISRRHIDSAFWKK